MCIHDLLPRWLSGKESACQCRRHGFDLWVGKIPWRRKWQPTPVILLGKSHGEKSLAGHSPWGRKGSDTISDRTTNSCLTCVHFKYRFIFKHESVQLQPGSFRGQAEGGCLHCLGGAGPVDHGAVGSDAPTPPPFPQCREVCGLNASDRCAFVRTNPDCRSDGGYVDYLEGIFCHFPARLLPLAITLHVRPCPRGCAGERGRGPSRT